MLGSHFSLLWNPATARPYYMQARRALFPPKFESPFEPELFYKVHNHFVQKTLCKMIALKALCWTYSVVLMVREDKIFTGPFQNVRALLSLNKI